MLAGAAIAAMAEQARMKACDKYMLKLGESSDVFEVAVGVLGWEAGAREDLYTHDFKSLEHIGLRC
jgi:hypothetical protein